MKKKIENKLNRVKTLLSFHIRNVQKVERYTKRNTKPKTQKKKEIIREIRERNETIFLFAVGGMHWRSAKRVRNKLTMQSS